MGLQQTQIPGDARRLLMALSTVKFRLGIQVLTQICIAYALDVEFAAQDTAKDTTILRTNRAQRSELSAFALHAFTYLIKQPMGGSWFSHYGERLQIALISGARDSNAPTDIGNAFTQGQPFHDYRACFYLPTAHLKALRIINGGFDAQHAASFVIHLDRVLRHPVPDSQPFDSPLQASSYFTPGRLISSPQKSQHILTMKLLDSMVDQGRIDSGQRLWVSEQDVRALFSFADGPIVRSQHQLAALVKPGIDFARQGLQKTTPVPRGKLITKLLGTLKISNLRKAVVLLLVSDSRLLQLFRQIFFAVEAHLDGQRQPGLQTHMHQPKLAIGKVEIEMQTLALGLNQLQSFALHIPTNSKRPTRLHASEDTNQALINLISFHNLPRSLFLRALRRSEIKVRALLGCCHLLGLFFHSIGDLLHKRFEVLVQHSLARQKLVHALQVTDRTQVAAEQNPVKTCYSSADAVFVPLQKTLHGRSPSMDLFSQTHHAGNGHGASLFLVAAKGRAVPLWWNLFKRKTHHKDTKHTEDAQKKQSYSFCRQTLEGFEMDTNRTQPFSELDFDLIEIDRCMSNCAAAEPQLQVDGTTTVEAFLIWWRQSRRSRLSDTLQVSPHRPMPKEPYVSDAPLNQISDVPLNEPARLCRRTVRKGCAFPTLLFFLLRLRLRWEAQPPVIFGELPVRQSLTALCGGRATGAR